MVLRQPCFLRRYRPPTQPSGPEFAQRAELHLLNGVLQAKSVMIADVVSTSETGKFSIETITIRPKTITFATAKDHS